MIMSLPVLQYRTYEETAFDTVPILEGLVDGQVVFGVLSLLRAEGIKNPNANATFGGIATTIQARVLSTMGVAVDGPVAVIGYKDAYEHVKYDVLAEYLKERRRVLLTPMDPFKSAPPSTAKRPPVPEQKPVPVVEKVKEPTPPAVVPKSPITMTELVLQLAAMQIDFDLRMQVMAARVAKLEAK
jgi:hypothetical protein